MPNDTIAIQQAEMANVAEFLGTTANNLRSKHDQMLSDVRTATNDWVTSGSAGANSWNESNNVITQLIEELAQYAVAYQRASVDVASLMQNTDRMTANSF